MVDPGILLKRVATRMNNRYRRDMESLGLHELRRWRQWPDFAELFNGADDPGWVTDRDTLAPDSRDRWHFQ